jgi:BirA family transcriptional regulator, biotin operon repressor / biotin---[acetyl-CoA-carboxylase] ligase
LYKIPANTLFLGKHLVFVPECHSTNTLALQMSQNPSLSEGTVIITNNQTAGRGQRGNSWEAAPGMNLTFSVIMRPGFLPVKEQFYLTVVTSLALSDYLAGKTHQPVSIKWPNDILVHGKKICGLLLENQLQGSQVIAAVIGIGLNVNQTAFTTSTATSLQQLLRVTLDLEVVLHEVLGCLETRYLQLRQHKQQVLKAEYLEMLYRRNQKHLFSSRDITFEGTITGIDENGKLAVETSEGIRYFGIKEIGFIM